MLRNLGLSAAAAGLLISGCAFEDDRRYDGGRYRSGGYSAGAIDAQGGRTERRSRGYSAGDVENQGLLARARRAWCDDGAEVCYKNGRPDISDTRDRYGRRAAGRIDD